MGDSFLYAQQPHGYQHLQIMESHEEVLKNHLDLDMTRNYFRSHWEFVLRPWKLEMFPAPMLPGGFLRPWRWSLASFSLRTPLRCDQKVIQIMSRRSLSHSRHLSCHIPGCQTCRWGPTLELPQTVLSLIYLSKFLTVIAMLFDAATPHFKQPIWDISFHLCLLGMALWGKPQGRRFLIQLLST